MSENPITKLIAKAGGSRTSALKSIAATCGLKSYQSILKWEENEKLPRTEWTGETNYAEKLEQAYGVSRHILAPGAYTRAKRH